MVKKQKDVSLFKNKRMRVTALDNSGRPIYGPESVITTNGQITTTFTPNVEEGESISQPNGNGDTCLNIPATPTYTGHTVEATFCKVDFALFEMLTGNPVVLNENGTIVGIKQGTTIDLSGVNFALELWTGAQTTGAARAGSEGEWGYILSPFLSGGTIGDIALENAAITFTVSGMQTKNGAAWGKGPHNVDLVAGKAAPLFAPLTATDHLLIISVEIAPPAARSGFSPLLDVKDPALTSITATPTGSSVAMAPVPTGTDPVEYDFGNGEWDYAETGSYTYVYPEVGTYTITARRGSSKVTKSVTVSA